MCTALHWHTDDHYFGRTLDLDCSYGEEVCILPRHFPLAFRFMGETNDHYAMIGMATVMDGVPLFYDAVNEYGLAMAGLNFPGNAYYPPVCPEKDNVPPFECIPWVLSRCKTVAQARDLLARINLASVPFGEGVPLAPLHWMLADREETIVIESMQDGLHIYDDPAGVMTNNPPFDKHLFHLNNYRTLRVDNGENTFAPDLPLSAYCQGLGAIGLPGDVSSMSRFVRATFGRAHAVCAGGETASVSQFFHLLSSVEMQRGCCRTETGAWDITVYSACMNTDRGRYYYTTYDNSRIHCVDMYRVDLSADGVYRYPLATAAEIAYQN